MSSLARAQGCLMGLLVGDALGSLVEFQPASRIAAVYPRGVRELRDGGVWNIVAGQPTDDGEMALSLARALIAARGWDVEKVARAYVEWLRSGPFDIGNTVKQALRAGVHALPDGDVASACRDAASRQSEANGALMRVAPIALLGGGSVAELAAFARADASLTHPHAVCQDASAVFVTGAATAIRTGGSAQDVYDVMRAAVVDARNRDAIVSAAARPPAGSEGPKSGWVIIALHGALYELLHAPSFEEGLVRTIARGGDTDTTAAITGALLGAVWGLEAIPTRWRDAVLSCRPEDGRSGVHRARPADYWPVDALSIAEQLSTARIL